MNYHQSTMKRLFLKCTYQKNMKSPPQGDLSSVPHHIKIR